MAQEKTFNVVKVSDQGEPEYMRVSEIDKYLNEQVEPGGAVAAIFTEIEKHHDDVESFEMWVSEVWDLVVEKNYWKGGGQTTFADWKKVNGRCGEIAKNGKALRDRLGEAVSSLERLGAQGARFRYMAGHQSRSFIEAVRDQMAMHSMSYPLVAALANIRAYHRINPNAKGRRGVQRTPSTQTCDVAELDRVTYRLLSDTEMAAANVELGSHGFFVKKGSAPEALQDDEFDEATRSFLLGKVAAEQPEKYGKATPVVAEGKASDADNSKDKPTTIDHLRFGFVSSCTCGDSVAADLKAGLDSLTCDSGYDAIEPLMASVWEAGEDLCTRHSQLMLVYGLGVKQLKRKTDQATLVREISDSLHRLSISVQKEPSLKENFSKYKQGLGFSWEKINKVSLPKGKGEKRKAGHALASGAKRR